MSSITCPSTTKPSVLIDARVRDLMTSDPVAFGPGITVREAAGILGDRGIGAAIVVNDHGRAIGVMSRLDVVNAVIAGAEEQPVREAMTSAVIAVQPDTDALHAALLMARCNVYRVFVLDEDSRPVGVVSTTDLLRGLKVLWKEYGDRPLAI